MSETALLLTGGLLATDDAKTAHGLVRGPSRFRLLGAVDEAQAGRDAGEVLDGHRRELPCFASLAQALTALGRPDGPDWPAWLVVGVAVRGGKLPAAVRRDLLEGIAQGIGAVNGLHQLLEDDPEIVAAALASGARLHDVRRVKKFSELRFWSGEALELTVPRLAVLGTDCAIGKRTTATFLLDGLRRAGLVAELVTTGQTGWLQGHRYGFVLDSTPNDFVTGELERAVVDCARQARPDVILLEGQSALRNPSGPCGAELLLAAGARGVVLQHAPGREFFEGCEELGIRIPTLADEIDLVRRYGAEVVGVALNGERLSHEDLRHSAASFERELGLPISLPLDDGGEPLLEAVRRFVAAARQ